MTLVPSLRVVLLSFTSALAALGCEGASPSAGEEPVAESHEGFEAWKAQLPRDPYTGSYLVEGDIGVRGDEVLRQLWAAEDQPGALIVSERADGTDDRWGDAEKRNLTYCVTQDFGDDHDKVVRAMAVASADWEHYGAVHFVHRGDQDATCNGTDELVVFEVQPASGTRYTAKAFLPSSALRAPEDRDRELRVDLANALAAAPRTLTGILRHELGHVLGFRHEHTRPEAGDLCWENDRWRALTPYDPLSVMHYNAWSRCEGANTGDYVLTAKDEAGVRALYGAPGP